jgi:trigger factor
MVQNETDRLIEERERYFGDGEKLQAYLESIKKTKDELRDELKPMAEGTVRRSIVLQKFAELEEIDVSASEISAEAERMMQQTADERVKRIFDSASTRETLGRNIFIKKAVDRLVEIATGQAESVVSEVSEEESAEQEPTDQESIEQQSKEEGDENGEAT